MIPIPVGTKHTVELRANVWKPIRCEQCGCEFAYRIKLSAEAASTNYLWLNRQGAIDAAKSEATNTATRIIQEANPIYPCPNCGIYQAKMVDKLKRDSATALQTAGVVMGVILFAILAILIRTNLTDKTSSFVITAAYSFSLILSSLVTNWFFARSRLPYNPNEQSEKQAGQPFSNHYPVLQRSELETLISKLSCIMERPI